MTDEEVAEQARAIHAESLRERGAHAVAVEQVRMKGRRRFAVIALVDDPNASGFPSELTINTPAGERSVPLVIRKQQRFHLD